MKKKTKVFNTVALASLCILLASTIVVGSTYSLWSDKTTIENHLTSGNLQLKLERTKLTKHTLDENGYLATKTNEILTDFTNSSTNTSNIFDIEDGELIVPQSYYEANLKLSNVGSVAFNYTVSLKVTDDNPNELAKQILVYVDDVKNGYLYDDTNTGKFEIAKAELSKTDAAKEFKVKIQFEDSNKNNSAMDQKVNFDLLVEATQKVEK